MRRIGLCVVGEGRLFEEVRRLLHERYDCDTQTANNIEQVDMDRLDLVVSLMDYFDMKKQLSVQERCREKGVLLFSSHLDFGFGFVGPWVYPDHEGCIACFHERRMRVLGQTQRTMQEALQNNPIDRVSTRVTPHIQVMAQMVVDELDLTHWMQHNDVPALHRVYVLSALTLVGELHHYLPDSRCIHCSKLPDDTEELAKILLQPQIKRHPWDFRVPNPKLHLANLRQYFYDWRSGLVAHLFRDRTSTTMPLQIAELPLYATDARESGVGRTFNFKDSELTAILEAVERYGGCYPHGKRTRIRGSYEELREQAINPETLGLHHPDMVSHPAYKLVPYAPTLICNWVWGYSFQRQKPMLIPEQAVYYRLNHMGDPSFPKEWFIYEISNGCAMGGSLVEAILHGLLEVIERDAFLLAWYGQLGATEICVDDVRDARILMIQDAVEQMGYEVHFFDITSDIEIPTVWAIAINPSDEGVKTYSAAGAHIDPEKAILGALVEVATSIAVYHNNPLDRREEGLQMLEQDELVRTIDDHVLLYTLPEAFGRFDFLFKEDRKIASARDIFHKWYHHEPHMDLTSDLVELLDHITKKLELDVLVVDQTAKEQEALGIHTVKVLVPGTLSMTFGALLHRTYNNDRLLHVPYKLGYWDRPKRYDELQIFPHPFP